MAQQIVGVRLQREAEQPDDVAFKNFQFAEQFFHNAFPLASVDKKAFAAYLIISAEARSVEISGTGSMVSADSLFLMAVAEHPPPRCSVMRLVCTTESQRRASGI